MFVCAQGKTGCFFDDQKAIKAGGAKSNGAFMKVRRLQKDFQQ